MVAPQPQADGSSFRTGLRMTLALVVVVALAGLATWQSLASGEPGHAAVASGVHERPKRGQVAACTRVARPRQSAQRFLQSLRPGDIGCLRGRTYRGSPYVLDIERPGITIRSYPGERARLVGIVHVHRGASEVTLSQLNIVGDGSQNTIQVYSSGFTLRRSIVTNAHRGRSCILLGSEDAGTAVKPVIARNVIARCGSPANYTYDQAIYAAQVRGGSIVENLIYDSSAYSIQLYPNADRMLVARNVIDGGPPSVRGGLVLGSDSRGTSSGNVVEQNVIAFSGTYNLTEAWEGLVGRGNVVRANCLWAGAEGNDNLERVASSDNVVANPRFIDRAGADYRLGRRSACLAAIGGEIARLPGT